MEKTHANYGLPAMNMVLDWQEDRAEKRRNKKRQST